MAFVSHVWINADEVDGTADCEKFRIVAFEAGHELGQKPLCVFVASINVDEGVVHVHTKHHVAILVAVDACVVLVLDEPL